MSLQITMTCSAVLASTGRMELSCLGWHWLVMNAVRMRLFLTRLAQPLLWSLRSHSCVTVQEHLRYTTCSHRRASFGRCQMTTCCKSPGRRAYTIF